MTRAGWATIVAAVGFLVVLGGAEGLVRHRISHTVSGLVRQSVGGDVEVAIGARPGLVDAVSSSVPELSISVSAAQVCPFGATTLDVTLLDVHDRRADVQVAGSRATIQISSVAVASAAKARVSGLPGLTVVPDLDRQLLLVRLGFGGLLQVDERPGISSAGLTLTPLDVTLAGQPASPSIRAEVMAKARLQYKLPPLALQMKARSIAVTESGLTVTLAGGPARQSKASLRRSVDASACPADDPT